MEKETFFKFTIRKTFFHDEEEKMKKKKKTWNWLTLKTYLIRWYIDDVS